jgi:hypothetical protein
MRLLLGVFGNGAARYADAVRERAGAPDIKTPAFVAVNREDGPLARPSSVRGADGKRLLLNGPFILRETSMDGALDKAAELLATLAGERSEDIPMAFVNGAYNGAIQDGDTLHLFNDYMALIPLYFTVKGDTLLFSTSLRILSGIVNAPWDADAAEEFLKFGYNWTYRTVLKGVESLPPGTCLTFRNGKVKKRNYLVFPPDPEMASPFRQAVEDVQGALAVAVKRIYSPRLKYDLSLTGGMDSRCVFLEWPDRKTLMTETSGEGTSDFLKARELAMRYGNAALHELEDLCADRYVEGIQAYYDACDNPTKLMFEYNLNHLRWKRARGADFHLSGVGGETFNGENLYLNRKPSYILQEALLPYRYHSLTEGRKAELLGGMVGTGLKAPILRLIGREASVGDRSIEESAVEVLAGIMGGPAYEETYCERFRTLVLANFAFYPADVGNEGNDTQLFVYQDYDFLQTLLKYHPSTRELRRLELAVLKGYPIGAEVPVDTSHIRIGYPYPAHKFMRAVRMVMNIGLHRKVPFIQKGDPPKFRAERYFNPANREYRDLVRSTIEGCALYDASGTRAYMDEVDKVTRFNFYTHHNESKNIKLLFRLAMAAKSFRT